MKISKFGGSSVASAEQIKKVSTIVTSDSERKVIVVSAPGKRFSEDTKVTDHFISLYHSVMNNQNIEKEIDVILHRFEENLRDLQFSEADIKYFLKLFSKNINQIIKQLHDNPPRLLDALKSRGEDFNAQIIAHYINQFQPTIYMSPMDIGLVVTDEPSNAMVLQESYQNINERLTKQLDEGKTVIVPGFYGFSQQKDIVTFSRGGSDLTGAIIAAALNADVYENFTDVSCIYSANPNVINQPKEIDALTYDEMRELSYAGFNVFHDEAIAPLYPKRIPVVIKNTNRPQDKGTYILPERPAQGVVGVSCDKGFTSINMKKYLMNREVGFTRKLLSILEAQHIPYEHMPSGIDNVSIILRSYLLEGKEDQLINTIQETLNVDDISVEKDLAILMIVGEGMKTSVGTATKATNAFSANQINIKMINQGSSEISMMFGIDEKEADEALKAIYAAYF